jgi:membrane-associated two-gene conflict system component 1 (EACC1)
MDVTIRVVERDAEVGLRSLRDWLAAEDELRGRLTLSTANPRPGEMGTTLDLLTVAVGSGGAATVLAGAISTWLRTRRPDVTVEVTESAHERTVKVTGSRIEDAEALIREVIGTKDG